MTLSKPRIPLASASSSTVPLILIHTTVKGVRKMLLRHTGLNASVSIHQTVSPCSLSLPPPLHTSTLPLLHFDRRLTLAPMLPSPHGPTLLPAIPSPFLAEIPPATLPFRSSNPRAPKPHLLLVQCPWIPRRLVALPSKNLLTFLRPFRAMFPWNRLQIPLRRTPILPSACNPRSLPSPVLHLMA